MTFANLVLHDKTRRNLEHYLRRPTHALILAGPGGVGLATIAKNLAEKLARSDVVKITPRLHNQQKTPNINIDDIRELRELTRNVRRENLAIVIDEAEKMTRDTPQALLKLLEEPVAGVFYILTSHAPERLTATIRSRTQTIEVLPPETDQWMAGNFKLTVAKSNQIRFLADRRPAEISRLISDEAYFREAASEMEAAKLFVQGDIGERLKIVASISGREAAMRFANYVAKLATLVASRADNKRARIAAENLRVLSEAIENLGANGNVRLQLLYLATNMV
jgi:DNA polymerase III delta prime subunit